MCTKELTITPGMTTDTVKLSKWNLLNPVVTFHSSAAAPDQEGELQDAKYLSVLHETHPVLTTLPTVTPSPSYATIHPSLRKRPRDGECCLDW